MQSESKLWYLQNISLFQNLPKKEMTFVEAKSTMRHPERNQYIYFPEDPSKTLYFLKSGRVKIGSVSADGKEIIKAILHPGEVFGELGVAGEEKRTDFAMALDADVIICAMSVADMMEMMEMNPSLALRITKLIGFRLKKIERRLEALVFKDTRDRIIDFLREIAEEKGQRIGDQYFIKLKLTHQDIGNLTGTARQTVTSILNDLKNEGIINFDRSIIIINEIKRLS